MGRKRKLPASASQNKMGRNQMPSMEERKRYACQNTTVVPGTFIWAKLPGCPMWPAKVLEVMANSKVLCFVKSDDAEIPISITDIIVPFKDQLNKFKSNGIGKLTKSKQPAMLNCFLTDLDWALLEIHEQEIKSQNTDQLEAVSHDTVSMKAVPDNKDQLEAVSHNTDCLDSVSHNTVKLEASSTNRDQLETVSHNTEHPLVVSHNTEHPLAVSHNTDQLDYVSHYTDQLESASHSTDQLYSISHNTNQLDSVSHSTDQLEAASDNTDQLESAFHIIDQLDISHNIDQLEDVSHNTGQLDISHNIDQLEDVSHNKGQLDISHNIDQLEDVSHNKGQLDISHNIDQLEAVSHNTGQLDISHNIDQLDAVSHNTGQLDISHSIDQLEAVSHNTDQLDSISHNTEQLYSVSHSTDQLEAISNNMDQLESAFHSTDQLDSVSHNIVQFKSISHSTNQQESAPVGLESELSCDDVSDLDSSGSEWVPRKGDGESSCEDYNVGDTNNNYRKPFEPQWVSESSDMDDSDRGSDVWPMLSENVFTNNIDKVVCNETISDISSEDESKDEDSIVRDTNNSKFYIRAVLRSALSKTGKIKKNARVYNAFQYCKVCDKRVSNFAQHIERNKDSHKNCPEIRMLNKEPDRNKKNALRQILRGKFNHRYNMKNIKRGHGEIILERRPLGKFNLNDFGPCPNCYLWISRRLLKKHQQSCIAKKSFLPGSSSLITQSDTLSGRITAAASKALVKEVFTKMNMDTVGKLAREDPLIVHLGNQWVQKNVGNKLKRGAYTSAIMRLVARMLLNLKKLKPIPDPCMSNYLKSEHFNAVCHATILTCASDMDDEEDLLKPSNAIKLGFDLKRLADGKIGNALTSGNKEERVEAEDFLKMMEIYWGTRITKLARVILEQRKFNQGVQLPHPEDIKELYMYLQRTLAELDLSIATFENYRKVCESVEARLIVYNRRRTGEVQAVRATSDILERTQIAKILLLQDHDRIGEFQNKKLEDIQFTDIVLSSNEEQEAGDVSEIPENIEIPDQVPGYDPDILEGALNETEQFDYEDEDVDEPVTVQNKPKQKNAQITKVKWTEEEEVEIKTLFRKYFETKTRPKPDFCAKAIRVSKAKGGSIFKRKKDVLKKKVFRMIDALLK